MWQKVLGSTLRRADPGHHFAASFPLRLFCSPFPSIPSFLPSFFHSANIWPSSPARRSGERCELPQWGPRCSPGRKSMLVNFEIKKCTWQPFCWNQNVHLKFLDQNGRQFTLHYARGATDTVGVTCTYGTGLMGHEINSGAVPRM